MILDFFFKKRCILCHRIINSKIFPSWLCRRCYESIEFIENIECYRCGSPFMDRCLCNMLSDNIEFVRSLFIYDGAGKELIHKWKYSNLYFVGDIFKRKIKNINFFSNFDGSLSVPIYFLKKIFRGFNQAHEIGKFISELFKIKDYSSFLIRKRYTKPQMIYDDYSLRRKNVKGIFKLKGKIDCRNLLIVDDIITSASTVNEITETLIKSEFKGKISVFTVGMAI